MITEKDLKEAIAECQGTRNPNANTCIKLASYYAILDHMKEEPNYSFASEPTGQVSYDSGSAFSDAIRGKDISYVLSVIDELMDTLQVLSPKLYNATMDRL
jgi:hypothetical protein